jgi:hypothetical protein
MSNDFLETLSRAKISVPHAYRCTESSDEIMLRKVRSLWWVLHRSNRRLRGDA